ncbi:hypothetical protein E4U57_003057 [Claviceps arundinis]|uniref:Uncharacterized protein n=1 Tax=Claviceps arundinis TaxID=1623583 RepID=A0A9P7SNP6_9HYPO|nr:hypothetical protein E4U57_003057 [Claviceps arundinis]KAG5966633.1 hypothetical protein E4U56_001218 [Claviceps arundinis]
MFVVADALDGPRTTHKQLLDDYLNAIEKVLCEPAPDEDDFVFDKYEDGHSAAAGDGAAYS